MVWTFRGERVASRRGNYPFASLQAARTFAWTSAPRDALPAPSGPADSPPRGIGIADGRAPFRVRRPLECRACCCPHAGASRVSRRSGGAGADCRRGPPSLPGSAEAWRGPVPGAEGTARDAGGSGGTGRATSCVQGKERRPAGRGGGAAQCDTGVARGGCGTARGSGGAGRTTCPRRARGGGSGGAAERCDAQPSRALGTSPYPRPAAAAVGGGPLAAITDHSSSRRQPAVLASAVSSTDRDADSKPRHGKESGFLHQGSNHDRRAGRPRARTARIPNPSHLSRLGLPRPHARAP